MSCNLSYLSCIELYLEGHNKNYRLHSCVFIWNQYRSKCHYYWANLIHQMTAFNGSCQGKNHSCCLLDKFTKNISATLYEKKISLKLRKMIGDRKKRALHNDSHRIYSHMFYVLCCSHICFQTQSWTFLSILALKKVFGKTKIQKRFFFLEFFFTTLARLRADFMTVVISRWDLCII